jgi:hypothetical protein
MKSIVSAHGAMKAAGRRYRKAMRRWLVDEASLRDYHERSAQYLLRCEEYLEVLDGLGLGRGIYLRRASTGTILVRTSRDRTWFYERGFVLGGIAMGRWV